MAATDFGDYMTFAQVAERIRGLLAQHQIVTLVDALKEFADGLEAHAKLTDTYVAYRDGSAPVEAVHEAIAAIGKTDSPQPATDSAPKVEPTADEVTAEQAGAEVAEAVRAALAKRKTA